MDLFHGETKWQKERQKHKWVQDHCRVRTTLDKGPNIMGYNYFRFSLWVLSNVFEVSLVDLQRDAKALLSWRAFNLFLLVLTGILILHYCTVSLINKFFFYIIIALDLRFLEFRIHCFVFVIWPMNPPICLYGYSFSIYMYGCPTWCPTFYNLDCNLGTYFLLIAADWVLGRPACVNNWQCWY